ncbi:MAG: radical SAM protein [Elusimicrobia bacterium]|nr:radical SAM protein [Elusimicrobiota bacterium]
MTNELNPLLKHVRLNIPECFNEAKIIKKQYSRIVNCLQEAILPPYEIIIHPSSICNLKCFWCIGKNIGHTSNRLYPLNSLSDPKNMQKIVKGILDYRIKSKGWREDTSEHFQVENVSFSGLMGEPLVAKESTLLGMRLLIENDIRVGLFTNGILMDEAAIETILLSAWVHFSIDAGSKKTYSWLKYQGTGETLFVKVLQNLNKLAIKKANSKEAKVEINAGFVLNRFNYAEVYDAARILKNLGVRFLRIKTDIAQKFLLNSEERKEAKLLLDKIKLKLVDRNFELVEIHTVDKIDNRKRSFHECFAHKIVGAIGSDGGVYPCNYHPHVTGICYGNAMERPFREIWEGGQRKRLFHYIPQKCPPVCDPFKNRVNKLFGVVKRIYCGGKGLGKLGVYKNDLLTKLRRNTARLENN